MAGMSSRSRTHRTVSAEARFTNLCVRVDTKAEFKEFADVRRRDHSDVAAASIRALKLLPPEIQDALIEGRQLDVDLSRVFAEPVSA